MKIELGYYRTLAGKVRVICTDRKGSCPIVALVNDEEMVAVYDSNGKTGLSLRGNSFDLIEPWRDPVKYSVDIHIEGVPSHQRDACSLFSYLFSNNCRTWHEKETTGSTHYRITVEEVTE